MFSSSLLWESSSRATCSSRCLEFVSAHRADTVVAFFFSHSSGVRCHVGQVSHPLLVVSCHGLDRIGSDRSSHLGGMVRWASPAPIESTLWASTHSRWMGPLEATTDYIWTPQWQPIQFCIHERSFSCHEISFVPSVYWQQLSSCLLVLRHTVSLQLRHAVPFHNTNFCTCFHCLQCTIKSFNETSTQGGKFSFLIPSNSQRSKLVCEQGLRYWEQRNAANEPMANKSCRFFRVLPFRTSLR